MRNLGKYTFCAKVTRFNLFWALVAHPAAARHHLILNDCAYQCSWRSLGISTAIRTIHGWKRSSFLLRFSIMTLKYLITGATGGLGSQVLSYLVANCPASEYAAASSSEANRKQFEDRGIAFRVVNYDDTSNLEAAFHHVDNLFFVSSNTFDAEKRRKQHQGAVNAAKNMNVKHVWSGSRLHANIELIRLRCGIHLSHSADTALIQRQMSSRAIY